MGKKYIVIIIVLLLLVSTPAAYYINNNIINRTNQDHKIQTENEQELTPAKPDSTFYNPTPDPKGTSHERTITPENPRPKTPYPIFKMELIDDGTADSDSKINTDEPTDIEEPQSTPNIEPTTDATPTPDELESNERLNYYGTKINIEATPTPTPNDNQELINEITELVIDEIISFLSAIFDFNENLTALLGLHVDGDLTASGSAIVEDLTSLGEVSIGDYVLPALDGLAGQVLKTDGNGVLSWQTDNSSTDTVTVGKTGSGADYIADGNSDDVEIQAAINSVTSQGGGVIKILKGVYDIRNTIIIPKDPKLRIEGEYITKFGYGGTELKANSTLAGNLEAVIKESGNPVADTSNSDHSHASQYSRLVINGNSKSDVGLLLFNTDHTIVSDCKFVGSPIGIDGQFNGIVSMADYAGGLRVERSSFLASNINIRLNSHTQDWITDSWF